jgi:hypothetical protein
MSDTFDLPSSFDPLGYEGSPPPSRRRCALPATAAVPPERAVNPRLAHLLPPAASPARPRSPDPGTVAAGSGGAGTDGTAADTGARLAALEDELEILGARLIGLEAQFTHKQAVHQDRLLEAAATLIDGRLGRRRRMQRSGPAPRAFPLGKLLVVCSLTRS